MLKYVSVLHCAGTNSTWYCANMALTFGLYSSCYFARINWINSVSLLNIFRHFFQRVSVEAVQPASIKLEVNKILNKFNRLKVFMTHNFALCARRSVLLITLVLIVSQEHVEQPYTQRVSKSNTFLTFVPATFSCVCKRCVFVPVTCPGYTSLLSSPSLSKTRNFGRCDVSLQHDLSCPAYLLFSFTFIQINLYCQLMQVCNFSLP